MSHPPPPSVLHHLQQQQQLTDNGGVDVSSTSRDAGGITVPGGIMGGSSGSASTGSDASSSTTKKSVVIAVQMQASLLLQYSLLTYHHHCIKNTEIPKKYDRAPSMPSPSWAKLRPPGSQWRESMLPSLVDMIFQTTTIHPLVEEEQTEVAAVPRSSTLTLLRPPTRFAT